MPGTALHVRTPDRLTRDMVILPIPDGRAEIVDWTRFVKGQWMVRTSTNLHRMPAELLVPVVAEFVDGIGWVVGAEVTA